VVERDCNSRAVTEAAEKFQEMTYTANKSGLSEVEWAVSKRLADPGTTACQPVGFGC